MKRRTDFTEQELLRAYENNVSIPAAAKALGVNRKTLWRWLKDLGVDIKRGKYQHYVETDWGSFAKWLRGYDKPLPQSVPKLVELSGCSTKAVESYLYRRTKALEQKALRYVQTYLKTNTTWPDGTKVEDPNVTVQGDLWTHTVTVYPVRANSFTIGVKAPHGYRRKN